MHLEVPDGYQFLAAIFTCIAVGVAGGVRYFMRLNKPPDNAKPQNAIQEAVWRGAGMALNDTAAIDRIKDEIRMAAAATVARAEKSDELMRDLSAEVIKAIRSGSSAISRAITRAHSKEPPHAP